MHKRLINEAIIELTIEPDGPILVKAGETGADPTRPDMEFVRTWYQGQRTVYLPGPSLKGVLRSHCERIVRSLDEAQACNPVDQGESCGGRLDAKVDAITAYTKSCFICQFFGNTALAGHLRTADAYPEDPDAVRTEERDGVAIDRIYGSVAVGPFQLEVATTGQFKTKIQLQNFTLAQLGLIALALRDLKLGRVAIGFGKSRGLGRVKASFETMTVRYPPCTVQNGTMQLLSRQALTNDQTSWSSAQLIGVGYFPELSAYQYPVGSGEISSLPDGITFEQDDWGEATFTAQGDQVEAVWRQCMPAWQQTMGLNT